MNSKEHLLQPVFHLDTQTNFIPRKFYAVCVFYILPNLKLSQSSSGSRDLILTLQIRGYSWNMLWALFLLISAAEQFIINVFIDNQFKMSMIPSVLIVTSSYFQGSGLRDFSSICEYFVWLSNLTVKLCTQNNEKSQ